MTAPIAPTSSTGTTSGTSNDPLSQAAPGGTLDKDAFIKLLVAQMTHQDPLAPTDGTAMATQLAQFASVEQLMNIGDKLDAQTTSNTNLLGVINNSSAMNLLGRTVGVQTDNVEVGGTSPTTTGNVTVPAGGGTLTLRITDANGSTVSTVPLGSAEAGNYKLDIANATKNLPSGDYHVAVDCLANGKTTNLSPIVSMHVDSVQFGSDGAEITSGTHSYSTSLITSITGGN